MEKTVKIDGMMCPKCSGKVKKALEALDGVDCAEVSHESGTAVIKMSADVPESAIKEAIENKGFDYLGSAE